MAKHIPERMCIGCREMHPKPELIKIVSKNGIAEVDAAGKKDGRGAYLCKNFQCIETARKKKALSRHFKMPVPDSLYDEVEELLDG
jgi:predicted RNA-binding protein YlxR (DUF448 family)